MKLSMGRPHRRMHGSRIIGPIAILLSASLLALSCSTPIIISGQNLPPEQRSSLHSGRGITLTRIGVEPTHGRLFVLAPGLYPVELTSKQDLESVDRSMASVLSMMHCEIEIEFMPGEEVRLVGKVRTGSFDSVDRYSEKGFHTEISLQSSIDARSTMIDTSECESWIDCDHVDKTRMMPITCK